MWILVKYQRHHIVNWIVQSAPKRICTFSYFHSQRVGTHILNESTGVTMLCWYGKRRSYILTYIWVLKILWKRKLKWLFHPYMGIEWQIVIIRHALIAFYIFGRYNKLLYRISQWSTYASAWIQQQFAWKE